MFDFLIPTQEEVEKAIKNIRENFEISLSDQLVLIKMKLIRILLDKNIKKRC